MNWIVFADLAHALRSSWCGGPRAGWIDPTSFILSPHRGHGGAFGGLIASAAVTSSGVSLGGSNQTVCYRTVSSAGWRNNARTRLARVLAA
ncbi:MAG TPA: hypothetical protein EYQ50_10110 [Verrucomicrobiales bacterium]|nr:hypothetical protein [Verrucomicrobiales bacterium]HIL70736.1 hypothetical protein [Verrucomicrobiota bacterium]